MRETDKILIEITSVELAYISISLDRMFFRENEKTIWKNEDLEKIKKKMDIIYRTYHKLKDCGVKSVTSD